MKRTFKRLGLMTLTGILALSQAPAALAATKSPGSGKSALSSYNAELATQRTQLSELSAETKELSAQIKAAQKIVKENKYMTKTASEQLAQLSSKIKATRQELVSEKGSNKTLRAAAKEARLSGDIETAKDKLLLLEAVQEKQIKLRTELVSLLETKLKYLNDLADGKTGVITDTDETAAETAADTGVTEEAAEVSASTEAAEETVASADAAEAAAEVPAEAAAEEVVVDTTVVTDEAVIEAAFDDGADLDVSDYEAE